MRRSVLTMIALIAVFALALTGCGGKEAPAETTAAPTVPAETTAEQAPELGLETYSLSTATWSSPNGATVNLAATPVGYVEGCSAFFIVRLDGEEVENVRCQWDGSQYIASADLNAANGLLYSLFMTSTDGSMLEIPLDAGDTVTNIASALESYCHVMVDGVSLEGGRMILGEGSVQVQAPRITNEGQAVTVSEAVLALSYNGGEVDRKSLELKEGSDSLYTLELENAAFEIPQMEDDQQLNLTLTVQLSNGHILTAAGGTFYYNNGMLLSAVG